MPYPPRDRRHFVDLHPRFLAGERSAYPERREKGDGVRIALLFGHVRRGHRAAAAGLVDHHRAHRQQLLPVEQSVDEPGGHVDPAAGPVVHDQVHRSGRLEPLSGRRVNRGSEANEDKKRA